MLNKWPPIRQTSYRNSGLRVQLRPAGSNNVISRVPSPAYFNSDLTLRSRFNNFPMKSILYQSNVSKNGQLKLISSRPNAYALKENRPKVKFNYITRPTKPVNINNFDATLAVLKPNEYIYEKFNMQKALKTNESNNESTEAIHTVEAPNLLIKHNEHINENLNSSEKETLKHQDRQVHQYQVREQSHDSTNFNQLKVLKNNENHHISKSVELHKPETMSENNDDNKNIDAVTAPLVQKPLNQYVDLYLPQLQQYLLEQKSILPHSNSYNPTYLVMQSKNLLSTYQKYWDGQFKPENGDIDSSFTQDNGQNVQSFVHTKPKQAVIIAEVYSTASPISFRKANIIQNNNENIPSLIHRSPTASQLVDNKPNYKTQIASDKNGDISKQWQQQQQELHLVKDFQNKIDARTYHGHQLKNDLILQEAEQNLKKKIYQQEQREQSTLDLHQQAIVEQFKESMRILVSDH
ncbi:unnamed protein product [Diamesa tonsa]